MSRRAAGEGGRRVAGGGGRGWWVVVKGSGSAAGRRLRAHGARRGERAPAVACHSARSLARSLAGWLAGRPLFAVHAPPPPCGAGRCGADGCTRTFAVEVGDDLERVDGHENVLDVRVDLRWWRRGGESWWQCLQSAIASRIAARLPGCPCSAAQGCAGWRPRWCHSTGDGRGGERESACRRYARACQSGTVRATVRTMPMQFSGCLLDDMAQLV